MQYFLGTLFILICILLIIVVLLQKGRGGGLGAAFGGAGSSAFGTRTGDVFTWVTIVLTSLFLLLSVGVTLIFRPEAKPIDPPALMPGPGEIAEDTWVEMRAGKATIYYTTDGTEPNQNSPICEKTSVKISPGTTLHVKAYKASKWSIMVGGLYGMKTPATAVTPATSSGPATTGPSSSPGTKPSAQTGAAPAPSPAPTNRPVTASKPTTVSAAVETWLDRFLNGRAPALDARAS